MSGFRWGAPMIRVTFTYPGDTPPFSQPQRRRENNQAIPDFRYAEWATSLQSLMANAKEGIELAAEDHGARLARYHLYVTRLRTFLKKLPGFDGAEEPLTWLAEEIDLLIHRWSSDLLRPAAAARQTPTNASRRFRMLAVLCVELFIHVGVADEVAREKVAAELWARGYRGDKGKFGANELNNWVQKVDSGEYPMAKEAIARMWSTLTTLQSASSEDDAYGLMRTMLDRTRLPALARSQKQKQQPIL